MRAYPAIQAAEMDLFKFFSEAGKVTDVKLISDKYSKRSKVGWAQTIRTAICLSACMHALINPSGSWIRTQRRVGGVVSDG